MKLPTVSFEGLKLEKFLLRNTLSQNEYIILTDIIHIEERIERQILSNTPDSRYVFVFIIDFDIHNDVTVILTSARCLSSLPRHNSSSFRL